MKKSILVSALLLTSLVSTSHASDVDSIKDQIHQEAISDIRSQLHKEHDEEIKWLALNIYHESRGEDMKGQMSVAIVTLNRVKSSRFPNTIKGVVQQPSQFSWYSDGKPDTPTDIAKWEEIKQIAKYSLEMYQANNDWLTKGSLHYYAHNKIKTPYWAVNKPVNAVLGNHTFL